MRVEFALLLALWPAAAEDYDPTEVLIRLRDRVHAHGETVPNHTCVETITRDRFESAIPAPKTCDSIIARRNSDNFSSMLRHATTDRLRLDVLLAEGREMFSWAGAGKFDGREIDVHLNAGEITVWVPPGLDVDVDARMRYAGEIRVGESNRGGFDLTLARTLSRGVPDAPRIQLDVDARVGQIIVDHN